VLVLAFNVGADRFALGCAEVVEVVPHIEPRSVPHAPSFVPGLFTYRGAIVPVVDLCQLIRKTPCPNRLSSRIIVVRPASLHGRMIGLLAERVLETVEVSERTAIRGGIELAEAPYLGEVFIGDGITTQAFLIEGLVAGPLRGLFGEGPTT
jgi:chemotaxis-related protein WspB